MPAVCRIRDGFDVLNTDHLTIPFHVDPVCDVLCPKFSYIIDENDGNRDRDDDKTIHLGADVIPCRKCVVCGARDATMMSGNWPVCSHECARHLHQRI